MKINLDNSAEFSKSQKELERAIEDYTRGQFGVEKIGDAWASETMLFKIINSIYPEETIIRHYRPAWLEGLELDIFLPELKLDSNIRGYSISNPLIFGVERNS
jgi:hypothetical protein